MTSIRNIANEAQTDSSQLMKQATVQLETQKKLFKNGAVQKYLAARQRARGGEGLQKGYYKTSAPSTEGHRPGQVQKADGYIRTIYDMMDLHYHFLPTAMGKRSMAKADDPILTTTTGVHNDIYGQDVTTLLNSEQNIYGLLEVRPWTKSGERYIDAFASATASGWSSENASLADTTKPDFGTFETDPRTIQHTFDVSQVEQLLAATDDDSIADDPFDLLRQWFGEGLPGQQSGGGEHPKHINETLGQKAADHSDTNAMETIDRAIASGAEESDDSALSDGDLDIYGFDRSANEFEANVIDDPQGQVFHLDLMDDAMRMVKENSDKNPQKDTSDFFWLTGHDTYQRVEDEMGGKERIETVRTTTGLNGVQTNPGNDVGVAVSTYKGIPIFESNDIGKDDMSRMYLVDKTSLFIKQLLPTQFYSTGTEVSNDPFALGRLGNEGAYVTIGELVLKNPVTQAKIRDLQ